RPSTPPKPAEKPPEEPPAQTESQAPPAPTQTRERPKPDGPPAAFDAPTTVLDGVGPKNAERLARLGLETLGDMLYHFPRRYDDYTQLKTINRLQYGEEVTVIATVQSSTVRQIKGNRKLVEVIVNDGSGALRLNWFNQPWIAKSLKKDSQVVLSGKIDQYMGRLVMNSPEWEMLEADNLHTNRIVPVYPLTARITQRWLRQLMNKVVTYWADRVQDPLPESVRRSAEVMDLSEALLQAHFPDSVEQLKAARHRLAFDEIFLLQVGVLQQKRSWENRAGHPIEIPEDWLQTQLERLPYTLTGAQQHALEDIKHDLAAAQPMNRLLQGDVGSGKTVVAALGIALVNHAGAQAALMAPTSILAEQHYASLGSLLAGEGGILVPEEIRLMIGATPEAEKADIRAGLESGQIKVVVGTHALIEDPVVFADLQLAIIDEQHRFGVAQRARLRAKGDQTNLLVMTATPIPRSLALTVYGDLDLSIIDEMPPGRQPVETHVLYPRERERAYNLIKSQLEAGCQAFIIYPLVEESDKSDSKAAVEEHERLGKEVFRNYQLGLLHGRLHPDDKEAVMTGFRDKTYDLLVSTTVVEVGVDVPNATVMLVEGANRFGLAQLHQLRGRVGRGQGKSYCLLIPETPDAVENERLQVMHETTDGFVLAERDLEQRGPGEFLGTRQAGFSELQMAALTDVHLIEKARRHAQEFVQQDPELEKPEHQLLRQTLTTFWSGGETSLEGDIS
ncbi:MAG: ATP-dependent DNA helicase RecG, partial [Anaerolineales bacterium]|nr:ATP-dependent DNA helicase RecG [Anaerolineales bacterium]